MRFTLVFIFSFLALQTIQAQQEPRTKVAFETKYGVIKAELYNETPLHKENFVQLIEKGFYDSLLFHRVIQNFMVQAGDPDSKNAQPAIQLGNGGPNYTLPAEILPQFYHKRGALAAARQPDNVNPKKNSSGSQFYFVQGQVFTTEVLANMQNQLQVRARQQEMNVFFSTAENKAYLDKAKQLQQEEKFDDLNKLYEEIIPIIDSTLKSRGAFPEFNKEQFEIYSTQGGAPHLDGAYTVFGEITEGFHVLDSIAAQPVDARKRPLTDVLIQKAYVVK